MSAFSPSQRGGARHGLARQVALRALVTLFGLCLAVGGALPIRRLFNASSVWSGVRGWLSEPVQLDGPAASAAVTSVACETMACWAVGFETTTTAANSPVVLLALHGVWRQVPLGANEQRRGSLYGVTCLSDLCWAVGVTGSGSPLILRLTLSGPRATPGVLASTRLLATLYGVSCRFRHSCWAVGMTGSGQDVVLAWAGASWHSVSTGSAPRSGGLYAVSCTGSTDCVAVGNGGRKRVGGPFVLAWHGHVWTREPLGALAATFPTLEVTGISCSSANVCWIVANYEKQYFGTSALQAVILK